MPTYDLSQWLALQEQIKAGSQMVSGMTPAEAQAALKTQTITTQGGTSLHVYNPGSVPTAQPPLQFPGTDAPVDAYWEYVNQGGTTSAGGAATSGPSVINNSNATITKTAAGATGIAGVLSMNLPTAAAAIAPLAGAAVGAGLYSLNPGLWEKISRALLPFCYPDTNLTPVVVDENGTTYFSKDAIDAVRDVISSEKITAGEVQQGDVADALQKILTPYPFNFAVSNTLSVRGKGYTQEYGSYYTFHMGKPVSIFISFDQSPLFHPNANPQYYSRTLCYVFASEEQFTIRQNNFKDNGDYINYTNRTPYSVSMYGKHFYYYYSNMSIAGESLDISQAQQYHSETPAGYANYIAYAMLYGNVISLPEGLSSWTGPAYPALPQPIDVFTRYNDVGDAEFLPFYPVTLPVGDPGVSASPLEVPDPPTTNPDPGPAINPWISPSPSPSTYPGDVPQSNPAQLPGNVPDYTPNLNPESDPSQEPSPEPAPEPDPAPNESNSGTSPIPIIPEFPVLPSAASSLLHVYNPTQGQIDAFGSWLWTTFSGDLIDTVSKLFNDPMDAVIGLHELYATPATSGSSTIRAGFLDSGVSSKLVGSRYTSINCGSVVVPEYYQNYLDYSPYTKCFVYLPFVGIVPVSADDIIGNAIQIKYNVDSYTGCCIAIITVARAGYSSTVYQFEGNCGVEIPITSGYQSTLIGGLLGVAGTAISGSPHVGLAAASLGRANLGKNEVSHSGSFGSSYGAMGAKIPYIIVKRPTQKSVVNYNDEYGFPAHKRVRIGDCSGYLRAREVHVVSPTATDEEKARIEEMLKEGVFVK